jgi:hypothetical protein
MPLKRQSHEVMLAYHMIIVTRHLQSTEHIVQETLVQVEGHQLQKEMLKTVLGVFDPALALFRICKYLLRIRIRGYVYLNYGSTDPA